MLNVKAMLYSINARRLFLIDGLIASLHDRATVWWLGYFVGEMAIVALARFEWFFANNYRKIKIKFSFFAKFG
ncbi:MAG: hypothetical protein R3B47_02245 [Bacteroidia bacterium]